MSPTIAIFSEVDNFIAISAVPFWARIQKGDIGGAGLKMLNAPKVSKFQVTVSINFKQTELELKRGVRS